MNKTQVFQSACKAVENIIEENRERDSALLKICEVLHEKIDYYDWVGFYLVDPNADRELVLGPYVGEATDHTRISFGQGICGQAAETEETFVIQDVSKEDNYLACGLSVKSEIVVPVFKDGQVVAELDIDSSVLEPFSEEDRVAMEKIAKLASVLF
ncbi:MAG: GAF domain-containing protein [Calditrichia bacterium]